MPRSSQKLPPVMSGTPGNPQDVREPLGVGTVGALGAAVVAKEHRRPLKAEEVSEPAR